MKLTNHNKDNTYQLNTYVMHGTIEMTHDEYTKVFIFLAKKLDQARENLDTYTRDSLSHLKYIMTIGTFSLGVCATKLIAEHYKLKGYKDQNYGIKIS